VTHIRTLCLFGPDLGVHERLLLPRIDTEKHICANYARHRHSSAGAVHALSAEHFERRADRRPQTSASCLVPRASTDRKRSSNDAIDPERPNAQTTKRTLTAREDVPALCAQTRIVAIARSRYTDCCWLVSFLLDRAILSPHCRIQGLMGRPKLGDPMNTTCGACGVPISKFRVLVSKCNVIFNRDARYLRCPSCRAAELHCAHRWGDWEARTDSACLYARRCMGCRKQTSRYFHIWRFAGDIQRKCSKCGYVEPSWD